MPAFKPLQYPDKLARRHWDKKKSLLAKAAGKTGIGEAADKAQAAFGKIDWAQFDIFSLTPMPCNPTVLKQVIELKAGVNAEWKRSVKPAVDALCTLRDTADEASKKLAKNKLLKDDVKLASEIAKAADILSVSLQLNSSFFDQVANDWKQSVSDKEKGIELQRVVATKTKEYLMDLLKGLAAVQTFGDPKDPQWPTKVKAVWESEVKQKGRSVSNNLKTNVELAKKFLKIWTTKFKGFDWETLGFAEQTDGVKLKAELLKFIAEVKREAGELAKDLK
jgi:hypothetical protein